MSLSSRALVCPCVDLTCTLVNSSQRTGFQDCRNKTNGHELGYCR